MKNDLPSVDHLLGSRLQCGHQIGAMLHRWLQRHQADHVELLINQRRQCFGGLDR